MLVSINCGKLDENQHNAVQQTLDQNPNITDWVRYLDSNWLINLENIDVHKLSEQIREKHDDLSLLITPMHNVSGWINTPTVDFIKKHRFAPTPPTQKSNSNNADKQKKSDNIIAPKSFLLSEADSLGDLMLDDETRQTVDSYFRRFAFHRAAQAQGKTLPNSHQNVLLSGPAGIGKSTLSKAMAMALKTEIANNHKVNAYFVKPAQLIGGYRGHTQINTQTLLDEAEDGIIVFDEIDTFLDLDSDDRMALNVINTHLGDKPNKPVIIGTLYGSNLQRLFNFNQGIASRFPRALEIKGQNNGDLAKIFAQQAENSGLALDPSLLAPVQDLIGQVRNAKNHNFGHIRDVDNIMSAILDNMEKRHAAAPDDFTFEITAADIPSREVGTGKLVTLQQQTPGATPNTTIVEFPKPN